MTRFAVLSVALGFGAMLTVPAFAGGDGPYAPAAPAAGLSATACKPAGRGVWIGNRFATVFCGPATATVKLGGRTLTFSKGTCIWTTNSFTLQLGTIFHSWYKPYPVNPALSIWTSSGPVARAVVHIYWQGKRTLLSTTRTTARANATLTGGTFEGRTAAGGRVTGAVRCG